MLSCSKFIKWSSPREIEKAKKCMNDILFNNTYNWEGESTVNYIPIFVHVPSRGNNKEMKRVYVYGPGNCCGYQLV